MNSSIEKNQIRIGSFFGTPLVFDFSWFLVALFLTFILADGYFPKEYPEWSKAADFIIAAITVALFFASILIHELAHSYVALKFNYSVRKIKLFIFGGITDMDEPKKASEEFFISIAGPVASLILAFLFYIASVMYAENHYVYAFTHYLYLINLLLGLFNLLPGFPLDGGRILRAIIWKYTQNFTRATNIAGTVGRFIGFAMVGIGFLEMMAGYFADGLWLSFIGWFLESAAFSQIQKQEIEKLLSGHRVKDAMTRAYGLLPFDTTVREFVEDEVFTRHRRFFFVEREGKIIGGLTLHDAAKVPREEWDSVTVEEIMTPLSKLSKVSENLPLIRALKKMNKDGVNQLPVVNKNGEIKGILTRESLVTYLASLSGTRK